MKNKYTRIILAVLLLLLICFAASACRKEETVDESEQSDSTQTELEELTLIDSRPILHQRVGFYVEKTESENERIADAVLNHDGRGIVVRAFSNGETTLKLFDYWGNEASIDVTVKNDEIIKTSVNSFSDKKSANVRFFGASGNGENSDTEAIQSAIDSLKDGGTVYFPAGRYLVDQLVIGEGITLKLQGNVENVADGYTEELAGRVADGEFAVIVNSLEKNNLILNHSPSGSGADGASNIRIEGGMIDLNGAVEGVKQIDTYQKGPTYKPSVTNTCAIVFSCGDNFTLDNCIIKDSYNGHSMQICGASNVNITNCMFAGFVCRPDVKGNNGSILLTRETIQIEFAHSGAIPPSSFAAGEYYYCRDFKITGCYFGDSDLCGYSLIPIGQHGHCRDANIVGLEISGNVFDNPYYSGIRFPDYENVEISGNKFISDQIGFDNGYFVDVYTMEWQNTYVGETTSGNANIVYSTEFEYSGSSGIDIHDNEFYVSGNSNKRVVYMAGTNIIPGAKSVRGMMRQREGYFTGVPYTGFIRSTNYISDVEFVNNKLSFSGTPSYNDYYAWFLNVHDLKVQGNTVDNKIGVGFTQSSGGVNGARIINSVSESFANTLTFDSNVSDKYVVLSDGKGGTIRLCSNAGGTFRKITLKGNEHMKLEYSIDAYGNAVVTVKCDSGYTFSGWKQGGSAYGASGTTALTGDITLTVS